MPLHRPPFLLHSPKYTGLKQKPSWRRDEEGARDLRTNIQEAIAHIRISGETDLHRLKRVTVPSTLELSSKAEDGVDLGRTDIESILGMIRWQLMGMKEQSSQRRK